MVFISPKLQLQDGIVIGKREEMVSEIGAKSLHRGFWTQIKA